MDIRRTTHATRQLRKLSPQVRDAINDAIDTLAAWPEVAGVKRLSDRNDYRLRVGRYRVFFEVRDGIIWITQIMLRNERTYQ